MVNLAVVASGTAVSATERKPANLTVERRSLFLLVAHDGLIPFALKVQNQSPPPFGGGDGVNVHVEAGRCVRVSDAHITGTQYQFLTVEA